MTGLAARAATALWLAAAIALGGAGAAGCFSCGTRPPPGPAADDLIDEGWALYREGRFDEARERFAAAREQALDAADATRQGRAANGLGWSGLRLGDDAAAAAAFDDAVALLGGHPELPDALCGRAGLRLSSDPRAARDDAWLARAADPDFESFHDAVAARHLDAVALLASLRIGDAPAAQDELDRLAPGNGLDPAVPATWVVAGAPLPTYAAALLLATQQALPST